MLKFGFLGPLLTWRSKGLYKNSPGPHEEGPRRGVGNSFQPAIDASREALTNCVIAPSAKMRLLHHCLLPFIPNLLPYLCMWDIMKTLPFFTHTHTTHSIFCKHTVYDIFLHPHRSNKPCASCHFITSITNCSTTI